MPFDYLLFWLFVLCFFRDRRELLWTTAISFRVWCVPSHCDFRRRLQEHPQRATALVRAPDAGVHL